MAFSFNSSFTAPTTTSTMSFGKGFGQTSFGFSSTTSTASVAPSFSFGGSTTVPSAFGSGVKPSFGSAFGSTIGGATTSTFSFTTPTATTSQSLFSGFGQTQTTPSFGGFGSTQLGTGSGLGGSSFGTGQLGGIGGIGAGGTGTSIIGTTGGLNFNQTQQQQSVPEEELMKSLFGCKIYGDERDYIIAHWNLLQALWGSGKGYYAQSGPSFEYNPENRLCRLKGIGYSVKPLATAMDALFAISVNKVPEDIRNQQLQLESAIAQILGSKPNITVHVDCIRPVSDTKSLVLMYVEEKFSAGSTRRIPNNEICSYLHQPSPKQQLMSMGIDNVFSFVAPSEQQLADYLQNPPAGIDVRFWKRAQLNNPNPDEFLPVPLMGFDSLQWRIKCQENELKVQETLLDNLSEDIANLEREQLIHTARMNALRQRYRQLEYRVLKIFIALSESPDVVFGPEEETLKARLEKLLANITDPQYFKNRVVEIKSALRLQDTDQRKSGNEIDGAALKEITEFLSMELNAINRLKEVVQADLSDMDVLEEDMEKLLAE